MGVVVVVGVVVVLRLCHLVVLARSVSHVCVGVQFDSILFLFRLKTNSCDDGAAAGHCCCLWLLNFDDFFVRRCRRCLCLSNAIDRVLITRMLCTLAAQLLLAAVVVADLLVSATVVLTVDRKCGTKGEGDKENKV